MHEPPLHRDLATVAADLRAGRVHAIDLAEACLARLDEANREATARATEADGAARPASSHLVAAPELARAAARAADAALETGADPGALLGIPVSVKDHFGVAGLATFAGTPRALPEQWTREGDIVRALRGQLAVVTGKTQAVELAFGGLGTNPHHGTPPNPWDATAHRVPGGSSSGAGVSLVEGSSLVALGTDTAGSARIPASMTGVVGLKTSRGRWPRDGIVPLSTTLDTPGLLARSVADVAFAFTSLQREMNGSAAAFGPAPGSVEPFAGSPSIGVVTGMPWADCSPGVAEQVERALAELEAAGALRSDVDVTIRKAQAFRPVPGASLSWTLRDGSSGAVLDSGSTTVSPAGRVRVEGLTFTTAPPGRRLVVTPAEDGDLDGVDAQLDCDDTGAEVWSVPGEVRDLRWDDASTLAWTAPTAPGGEPGSWTYDLVRTLDPAVFETAVTCAATAILEAMSTDLEPPGAGNLHAYLVVAANACGRGPAGRTSAGASRAVRACP